MSRTVIIQDNVLKSDSDIKILKVLEESKIFRVIGKLTHRLTTCSYCRQNSMVKNGFKTVYIINEDPDEINLLIFLFLKRKR